MMPPVNPSDLDSTRRLKRHSFVLVGLALLGVVLSLVLWFHSTAGYASGGILSGAWRMLQVPAEWRSFFR
jgi:hypothetical protein